MPRVNYRGEVFELPEVVDGQSLRHYLQLAPNEVPVKVSNNGDYVPIGKDEYHIQDGEMLDKINRLANG